jgi:hypothetical protein
MKETDSHHDPQLARSAIALDIVVLVAILGALLALVLLS